MQRLRRILLDCDTEPVALGAGLYTALYGVWYLGPATFAGNQTYALIGQGVTETQFGALAITLGALPLVGVLMPHAGLRRWGAAAGTVFWVFLTLLNGVSSHWAAGGLPHFGLAALAHAWLYLRRSLH